MPTFICSEAGDRETPGDAEGTCFIPRQEVLRYLREQSVPKKLCVPRERHV